MRIEMETAMKDRAGKGVIRLGDKTSHGGTVLSGDSSFKVLGKPIACEGDLVLCPKCRGYFPVHVKKSDRVHHGKKVAYAGDKTACGASLISSI